METPGVQAWAPKPCANCGYLCPPNGGPGCGVCGYIAHTGKPGRKVLHRSPTGPGEWVIVTRMAQQEQGRTVRCPHCGLQTPRRQAECVHCHKWWARDDRGALRSSRTEGAAPEKSYKLAVIPWIVIVAVVSVWAVSSQARNDHVSTVRVTSTATPRFIDPPGPRPLGTIAPLQISTQVMPLVVATVPGAAAGLPVQTSSPTTVNQAAPGDDGRSAEVLELPPPVRGNRTGTTFVTLTIINDSPEWLQLELTGTDGRRTLLVNGCTTCQTYRATTSACVSQGRPTANLDLVAGDYTVLAKSISSSSTTPYAGRWTLQAGYEYTDCFFIVEQTIPVPIPRPR